MNYSDSASPIFGVQREMIVGQHELVDELNTRIGSRQFPDAAIRPNFDPRSVPTKYAHFPILNRRTPPEVSIDQVSVYSPEKTFSPMTQPYPFSSYLANIDVEIMLRNASVSLQHGADQGVYVPMASSDLYKVRLPVVSQPVEQTHPLLFGKDQTMTTTIPSVIRAGNIGNQNIFNHTRVQLRG